MNERGASEIIIRPALPSDAGSYLKLVEEFAAFESLPPPDTAAKTRLIDHLFRERPAYRLLVAEVGGVMVAYAAHFLTYSTFAARPTFLLEDIFVLPEYRQRGIGHRMFVYCARTAVAEGCGRMDFIVLNWNEAALAFYTKHGVDRQSEWQLHRLEGEKLEQVAGMDLD